MTVDIESGKELLKRAIKGEVDGLRFYSYLAEKVDNKDARRKLTTLASDEKRHKAILTDIYRKLYKEEVGELPEQGINALAKFFDTKKAKGKTSEMEFIDLAIDAELAATKFYKEEAKRLEDSELKEIYVELSEEEFSHYESLMAEKEALSGNYHWFSLDEGAPMEM
jgi:rubrerythrin